MRVVLVGNTTVPDTVGGLPRYVRELATALSRAGCETIVVAKRVDARAPAVERADDGVQVVRHSVPSKRNPLFGPAYPFYSARGVLAPVRSALGAETVVHAHFAVTTLPLALTGTPYLYTFHAPLWRELLDERQGTYHLPGPLERPAVAAVRAAERLVVRRSAHTFVLSEFMRGQLRELSDRVAHDAQLLPGGVDLAKFSPGLADSPDPVLFTARRLTPRTGVDRLLRALPEIIRAHPTATAAIAGTGVMEEELRRLAGGLGVAERVRFLGRLSDVQLVDWYRRATLVVMPTIKLEGFGLTSAEALACGTPVVGTPVGAIPELLDPELISADSSPTALAAIINELLAHPDRMRALGERGRALVTATMGWDAIAARYLEAYSSASERLRRSEPRGPRGRIHPRKRAQRHGREQPAEERGGR
jgi:glycosyltransferase involved in cell wall biosynthesis